MANLVSRKYLIPLLFLLVQCGNSDPETQEQPEIVRSTNVSVYELTPDSLTQYSHLPFTVNAWREVTISALEPGVVAEIYKEIGDQAERGEVLAKLNVEILDAESIQVEADLKFQTYNYDRARKLFSEGSISEQAFYASEYDLKHAESNALTIRRRIAHAQVRAPFPGKIAERMVELGQLVPVGGPVFQFVQTDRLRIVAWVPENEITDFTEGSRVEITFNTSPDRLLNGIINRIGPAAQSTRRVFPIEVYLPNPDDRIKPGMIGRIKAIRRVFREVISVPRESIQEREAGPAAFVIENNIARLRQLHLGASEGDKVIVSEGLKFSEVLVVKGGRDLIDGDRVSVTENHNQ